MINYLKNIRFFVLRICISIIILIAGMYFSITSASFSTKYNKIKDFNNVKAIEIQNGDILEQNITFDANELKNIGIATVNCTNNCSGDITLALWDETRTLWNKTVSIDKLVLGRVVWFDIHQNAESGKIYTFKVSADDIKGKIHLAGIAQNDNSQGISGNVIKNGSEQELSLVLETTFSIILNTRIRLLIAVWSIVTAILIIGFEFLFGKKERTIITLFLMFDLFAISSYFWYGLGFSESFNYLLFTGIVFSFIMAALVYLLLYYKKCEKVELYFLTSALIFGIVYSLVLPPFSAPDEDHHFVESYKLSNLILNEPIKSDAGYVYMRQCDVQNYEKYPNNEYTIDYVKGIVRGNNESTQNIVVSNEKRGGKASAILYMPQAVGISIGRVLHLNYERTVFLGRFINLLTYITITAFAIKIMPYGKWIIFAISQIPVIMEVVSSYSYDALTLSVIFMLMAYFLKLYNQKNQILLKEKIFLAIFAFCFGFIKPVYVPLVAVILLIPNKTIDSDKKKSLLYKAIILIMAMTSCVLLQKTGFMSTLKISNSKVAENINNSHIVSEMELEVQEYYQLLDKDPTNRPTIGFMLENPFDLLESVFATYIAVFDEILLSMFGNYLGWYHIRIPVYISIIAMILMYYAYQNSNSENIKTLDLKSKYWVGFLATVSFVGIMLSMYMRNSKPSDVYIIGVQGRYIVPLFVILPFMLNAKSKKSETSTISMLMMSLAIQILSILSVCKYIWS